MNNFTFLTKEQVKSYNKSEVIYKRGIQARPTDFAIVSGCKIDSLNENNDNPKNKIGWYWTSHRFDKRKAFIVKDNSSSGNTGISYTHGGARPVIQLQSLDKIPTNGQPIKRASDGILEVEYGYYPQSVPSLETCMLLEEEYIKNTITNSNNMYKSALYINSNKVIGSKENNEFIFNNKRYIRFKSKIYNQSESVILSNGEKCTSNDNVWIEVQPIKWLIDENKKIMISDKILFSGIPIDLINENTKTTFRGSYMDRFLNNVFSKDILQVAGKGIIVSNKDAVIEEYDNLENHDNKEYEQKISNDIDYMEERKNRYNFKFDNISEADIIKAALESNVSIFLHGKPGCGKSDRVKQLDPDFIELNLSHLDPELLDGLAGEKDGKAVHIKPPWLEELEDKCINENDKIHILFLEELTNASPMMQSKAYGIALDKKVAGRWKLPENARVVAAGNELEDSLVANEMAEPLYDRFAHVNIETNAKNWLEWAVTPDSFYERIDYKKQNEIRQKIHPAIYAYISDKGKDVLRTNYDRENPKPHADPRRWKMASDMLYASNNPQTLKAVVGEDITNDFIDYCRIPTITLDDVLNKRYTEIDLIMNMNSKVRVISGLVNVDDENVEEVRNFVKKIGQNMCDFFDTQWACGNEDRLEKIQEMKIEDTANNIDNYEK